jgi:protein-ribulosamine 3-kinase
MSTPTLLPVRLEYTRKAVGATLTAGDFPSGTKVIGVVPHGSAYWTRTAAIQTVQADNSHVDYFLKVCRSSDRKLLADRNKITRTEVGKINLHGEYASIAAIAKATPDLVPVPIAVGTYATDSDVHFYLASFVDMTDDVPDAESLPARVAEMHLKGVSPQGKYGFVVPTNMGACTQQNLWTSSWEKCFSTLMSVMFEFEQQMHGPNEEMRRMHQIILNKVIPRLLRPLETGGREIQPRIVHGDMWDGNTSVDATTDKPIIFDASGMYAHNECEMLSAK